MSYINTALKKVQKERDRRYTPYDDIISSSRGKASRAGCRRIFTLPVAAAVFFVLLSVLAYFLYQAASGPVKGALTANPRALTVAQKAAVPQAAPEEAPASQSRAAKLYDEALKAQRGKRWKEAEIFYKQALSFEPRHIHALNNLGVYYMSMKRYDEALELFVKAVIAKDDYVDPYYNLACLYAQLDDVNASLGYLERAVKIDGRAREWAKNDADFKKLSALPEFKKITKELQK